MDKQQHEHDPTQRARERAAREPCTLGRTVLIAYALAFLIILIAASIVVVVTLMP